MEGLDGFLERDRDRLVRSAAKGGFPLNPEDLEDRRAKVEVRMNLEARKFACKFYRKMLGWVLLIGVSAGLLALYFPAVALMVFVVLPFAVLVLYLVWKGWIQKLRWS